MARSILAIGCQWRVGASAKLMSEGIQGEPLHAHNPNDGGVLD